MISNKEECPDCKQPRGFLHLRGCLYLDGVKRGIRMYAHWKNGVQYVGTCGTTLKVALNRVESEGGRDED